MQLLHDSKVANGESGVHFTLAPDGRASGEAFVELCSEEDVSKAIGHNNEHMGKRYVEIFRASQGQMQWDCRLVNRDAGGFGFGGGGVGSGGVVRLRGLPFRCAEDDVRKFFQGLEAFFSVFFFCVGISFNDFFLSSVCVCVCVCVCARACLSFVYCLLCVCVCVCVPFVDEDTAFFF